jgi:hypothetical protein
MKPIPPAPVYDQTRDDRLRDEFAMAALTGLLAGRFDEKTNRFVYAEVAYTFADAMLKQREAS